MFRTPWLSLGIAITILVVSWQSLLDRQFLENLWYSRDAILEGELWRLLSGHLIHHSVSHLLFNLSALTLLLFLIETKYKAYELFKLFMVLCVCTGILMLMTLPELAFYGGISAINYGLLAWVSLHDKDWAWMIPKVDSRFRPKFLIVPALLTHCVYQWQFSKSLFSINSTNPELVVAWQVHLISIIVAVAYHFAVSTGFSLVVRGKTHNSAYKIKLTQ